MRPPSAVCVFCGTSTPRDPLFSSAARDLGHYLAASAITLVYGGGRVGLMGELADACIALPGGLGTLEEVAEAATWTQLGLHAKPVVLLDVAGFWDPMIRLLDGMVEVGLLKEATARSSG